MSGATVRVRDVRLDDLTALADLYRQLVADDSPEAQPVGEEAGTAILRAVIEDPNRSLLVAEIGESVVGTVDELVVANLTHRGQPWAIVENMVVDEAQRRHGVGSQLMNEVLNRARTAGCYKIQLLSRKVRTEAHAFYRSMGFEESAVGLRRYL